MQEMVVIPHRNLNERPSPENKPKTILQNARSGTNPVTPDKYIYQSSQKVQVLRSNSNPKKYPESTRHVLHTPTNFK
jgi:hypothetical protein